MMGTGAKLAGSLVHFLRQGAVEQLSWTCEVLDVAATAGRTILRSEFISHCPYAGTLVRLRCQCDRWPVAAGSEERGIVEFNFSVESMHQRATEIGAASGVEISQLFRLIRGQCLNDLRAEAREPLFADEPPDVLSFDDILELVRNHNPFLWRWRQVTHEGGTRELEQSYETRIDGLQFTVREFTSAETGRSRFVADVGWAVASDLPAPLLTAAQARELVAMVKEQGNLARRRKA